MKEPIQGRIFKFGDRVDSENIIPARYLIHIEPDKLSEYAFEVL